MKSLESHLPASKVCLSRFKGEDDPLRRLGDEDLLGGDWTARPADMEYDVG